MSSSDSPRTDSLEQLVFHNGFSRVLIGASVAMLASRMMNYHGGIETFDGITVLGAGVVVWAAGLTLTIRPVVEELADLRRVANV